LLRKHTENSLILFDLFLRAIVNITNDVAVWLVYRFVTKNHTLLWRLGSSQNRAFIFDFYTYVQSRKPETADIGVYFRARRVFEKHNNCDDL